MNNAEYLILGFGLVTIIWWVVSFNVLRLISDTHYKDIIKLKNEIFELKECVNTHHQRNLNND